MSKNPRGIARLVPAMSTSDGAGVSLRRSIGSPQLDHLDPFLLLDCFFSDDPDDYIAGFPDHPHRGFETVTYMIEGRMRHKDSTGGEGLLSTGGAQWMTAGRGVIHSEMPEQEEGRMQGFQLWVNLPAASKMVPARYQDIQPDDIPQIQLDNGGILRLIAGQFGGKTGPVNGVDTDPIYMDVTLPGGSQTEIAIPAGHTAFAYVFDGSMGIADETIPHHALAVLSDGDHLLLKAGPEGGRAIVVAGRPIGEPVARYGPFVMNTKEEIMQAIRDYQSGTLVG